MVKPIAMAEYEDDDAAAALVLINLLNVKKTRNRTIWTKQWISRRLEYGAYHCLLTELRDNDPTSCSNFLRMDWSTFEDLLRRVGPLITKEDTVMRASIRPEERLAVTLRWLATGVYLSM
jgi:hypothetical protein